MRAKRSNLLFWVQFLILRPIRKGILYPNKYGMVSEKMEYNASLLIWFWKKTKYSCKMNMEMTIITNHRVFSLSMSFVRKGVTKVMSKNILIIHTYPTEPSVHKSKLFTMPVNVKLLWSNERAMRSQTTNRYVGIRSLLKRGKKNDFHEASGRFPE